ncbi:BON domain-containing protein [Granulicella rosea]|nr:BON domain-containing protein [Granulicella rosea]
MRVAVLTAGMIAISAGAMAQSGVPDAQVEANVLKALAGAPELANESIRTTTVYGTVTLSGSVRDESLRTRAENLAANANGVKKVVDELTLGVGTPAAEANLPQAGAPGMQDQAPPPPQDDQSGSNPLLQSDGTIAPAPGQPQAPDQPQMAQQQDQPPMPTTYPNGHPINPGGDPNAQQQQPSQNPYGAPPQYPQRYPQQYAQAPYGGQPGGALVTVPTGTMIRIRVNQPLSSNHSKPGMVFDGVVANDVIAGGAVAIPRGATVQGKVVDAKASGALKGRGELSLQITQVMMGGKVYPINSTLWAHNGSDKTIETVNKTAGFGAIGALLGAAAGGGVGAAVGGGIGAAAGLGSSATSGGGQVFVPSEGIITFNLAQEVAVTTVSEQEMQRLAYGVPAGAQPGYPMRRRVYYAPGPYPPGYYYGPGYYYPPR